MTNAELIKAAAEKVGQYLYEHRGSFYKHYVDDRDACASWNPLRHMNDAMEILMKKELDISWSFVNENHWGRVGTVVNEFTPETKVEVLLLTITESVVKS